MAKTSLGIRSPRSQLAFGWEERLKMLKKQEANKSATRQRMKDVFKKADEESPKREQTFSLPRISGVRSKSRIVHGLKLMSPIRKKVEDEDMESSSPRCKGLDFPGTRNRTPTPVHSRIFITHLTGALQRKLEATTQCQDHDFPFSPNASVYDTGDLSTLRRRPRLTLGIATGCLVKGFLGFRTTALEL